MNLPGAAAAADAGNPACAAALDFILSVAGHGKHATRLVVAEAPDTAETKDLTADNILDAGWTGDPPSAAFAAIFLESPAQSALDSCPSLAAELAKDKIASGDDAVAKLTTADSDVNSLPEFPADVLTVSLPVLSADGLHALLEYNLCAGVDMCSGGIQHMLRDKSGRWKRVGRMLSVPS
ncbi:MAG: hypothetical protein ACREEB_08340 [Caulobacteraceae bacterium]